MAITLLRIDGMSCGHCVQSVTKALESLPGVSRATVVLEEKKATVEHAEGTPPLPRMIAAIQEEGYSATGV